MYERTETAKQTIVAARETLPHTGHNRRETASLTSVVLCILPPFLSGCLDRVRPVTHATSPWFMTSFPVSVKYNHGHFL
jgi:hypothetical protein